MEKIKYLVSGDCTVCVEFGNEISPEINRRIRAFKIALEKEAVDGVVETIPTYRSLSVVYRPEVIRFGELTKKFDAVLETMDSIQIPPPSVIEIPVLYGGDMGPDLEFVAAHNHKTPEEVVRIHTSGEYLIYMLGFIAGFPYLGGMSREIAAPRLKSPRVKIEGGSVGIAGEQTGIYPVASPGGWQLIGRTPLKLYDAEREKPVLLEAGQYIKFRCSGPRRSTKPSKSRWRPARTSMWSSIRRWSNGDPDPERRFSHNGPGHGPVRQPGNGNGCVRRHGHQGCGTGGHSGGER